MEIQKKTFEWGFAGIGFSTNYKLFGTQLDYDFIQACLNGDNVKMQELIKKGANPNVNLEIRFNDKAEYGTILKHLALQQPSKNIQITALKRDLDRLKKLANEEQGRYYDNLYKQTLQEFNRLSKKQENENIAKSKQIIENIDFLLSIGGRFTQTGERLGISEIGLQRIGFKQVKEYIQRAKLVDDLVEEHMGDMYDHYEEFLAKTTELRNSGKTIQEIKEFLKSEISIEPAITDYIDKRFVELQQQYGDIFTLELLERAKHQFNNINLPYGELVKQVDKSIAERIESMMVETKVEEQQKYERENKTFSQIKNTHEKLKDILLGSDSKLFIAGGSVPYFILDEDSKRTHDDIDTLADLSDMSELRQLFKGTEYYKPEWDTLTYVQDGDDYGFEMIIEGVPVGIYPFRYDQEKSKVTQYTFDPYLKRCRIKEIEVTELSDYVATYKTKNGEEIHCQALEQIKLSKIGANRAKDIADNKKIDETGLIREEVYLRINPYQQVQDLKADDLNKKTLKYEAIGNAIERLDYELTKKHGMPLSNQTKEKLMEQNVSKNYLDIRKNLAQARKNIIQNQVSPFQQATNTQNYNNQDGESQYSTNNT
ncbi:MAG: hypothetical protein IKM43_01910 [Clostridia bacterium]|nr:hypothetical protein [Clostridia bacterium]